MEEEGEVLPLIELGISYNSGSIAELEAYENKQSFLLSEVGKY